MQRAPRRTCQVVIVHACGAPSQRTWRAELGNVVSVTAGQELSPCIVIVGEVSRAAAAAAAG
jgi:siroheme synthase